MVHSIDVRLLLAVNMSSFLEAGRGYEFPLFPYSSMLNVIQLLYVLKFIENLKQHSWQSWQPSTSPSYIMIKVKDD